jgi:hypothetical protein
MIRIRVLRKGCLKGGSGLIKLELGFWDERLRKKERNFGSQKRRSLVWKYLRLFAGTQNTTVQVLVQWHTIELRTLLYIGHDVDRISLDPSAVRFSVSLLEALYTRSRQRARDRDTEWGLEQRTNWTVTHSRRRCQFWHKYSVAFKPLAYCFFLFS